MSNHFNQSLFVNGLLLPFQGASNKLKISPDYMKQRNYKTDTKLNAFDVMESKKNNMQIVNALD